MSATPQLITLITTWQPPHEHTVAFVFHVRTLESLRSQFSFVLAFRFVITLSGIHTFSFVPVLVMRHYCCNGSFVVARILV